MRPPLGDELALDESSVLPPRVLPGIGRHHWRNPSPNHTSTHAVQQLLMWATDYP
jgi:hypothetical protein